jgi:hypothetical protein
MSIKPVRSIDRNLDRFIEEAGDDALLSALAALFLAAKPS